ncbi:MSHA biogenesis protein MshK [uncultured Paraglaciecola sp.]|uniref:MSHA biogenesis protein MshK n=1 Tax=uncultured Paraglaciecola sp. TaxID=1765024 RepID=UPI0030DAF9E5|tara:strand:+ start:4595 stop:4945 length:351 start_codon:yes stop_codon:yes gene_type:complete
MKIKFAFISTWLLVVLGTGTTANAQTLIDPTRPMNAISSTSAEAEQDDILILNAIFINGVNKRAIINGMNVEEGQNVAGKTLISISKNRVVLRGANGSQELFVNQSQFIKDANDGF